VGEQNFRWMIDFERTNFEGAAAQGAERLDERLCLCAHLPGVLNCEA
jgi:hypothetical protein